MKDENYFTVQGWMINRLGLSGNELNIFAIIYGFSQDDASSFDGSSQYLADFCGISKVSTLGILSKLTEKGFILKTEKYVGKLKLCSYKTTSGIENLPVKKLNHSGKETLSGGKETYPVGGKETLPNNKYINNDISNNIYNVTSPKKEPKQIPEQAIKCASLLAELHKQNIDTGYKINPAHVNSWAKDIELLNRIDDRSWEDIESVIRWTQTKNCFWSVNIISGKKLREKFDVLIAQMKQPKTQSYSNSKYHVEQGVPRKVNTGGDKEIHVDLPEDIF